MKQIADRLAIDDDLGEKEKVLTSETIELLSGVSAVYRDIGAGYVIGCVGS